MSSIGRQVWDQIHRERTANAAHAAITDPSKLFRAVAALTRHETEHWNLMRLIQAEISREPRVVPRPDVERQLAGIRYGLTEPPQSESQPRENRCLEQELSAALEKEIPGGAPHGGVLVPLRLKATGLNTGADSAGGYSIGEPKGNLIDFLAAQSRVIQLGAELVSVKGNYSFPIQKTVSEASWVAEGAAVTDSDGSFDNLPLTARCLTATSSFSRKLAAQSSLQMSADMAKWLTAASAQKIDQACIVSGTTDTPVGILGTSGVTVESIATNGGVPTDVHLRALVRDVAEANADYPSNAFLTTPRMREVLSATPVFTNATTPLWENGQMLGFPAVVSTAVPSDLTKGSSSLLSACHAILFGDFRTVAVCEWGALELVIDPFRLKKTGMVEITSYLVCDVAVRQPTAFAVIKDAKTA